MVGLLDVVLHGELNRAYKAKGNAQSSVEDALTRLGNVCYGVGVRYTPCCSGNSLEALIRILNSTMQRQGNGCFLGLTQC